MQTATRQRKQSKIRAHELAHELGITWRDLAQLAQRVGLEIRNQLCGLDEEQSNKLREAYRQEVAQQARVDQVSPTVTEQELPAEGSLAVTHAPAPPQAVEPAIAEPAPTPPVPTLDEDRARVPEQVVGRGEEVMPTAPPGQARREQTVTETIQPSFQPPVAQPKVGPSGTAQPTSPAGDGRAPQKSPIPSAPASASASPGSPPVAGTAGVSAAATPRPAEKIPPKETAPSRPTQAPAGAGASTSATGAKPGAPTTPGSKPVKHLVNLDQLRRRQQEIKQQQAGQQVAPSSGQAPPAARSQPSPSSPATPSSSASSPAGPSPAASSPPPVAPTSPVKPTVSGPVPVIQRPKPTGPAAPSTPPQQKTPPTPNVSFVVRKAPPKPPKEKPPKTPQELKPLATLDEVLKQQQQQAPKPAIAAPTPLKPPEKVRPDLKVPAQGEKIKPVFVVEEEEEEGRPAGKRRPGAVIGREERRQRRREEARLRAAKTAAETLAEQEQEAEAFQPVTRRVRAEAKPPAPRPVTQPRKGKVPIEPPITVRSLSEALGVSAQELLRKLIQKGQMLNINATLPEELAEELALEYNLELEIKKPADPEEEILKQLQAPDRPEDLVPRPPVVTVMGHVDHGKTSLLDRIRESDVVSTEAGGITQHLRAWQVEHGGRPITFLDTPGHEAFTAMRARGAHVTDIVVLVVAADDGVMPQTEEAISHARAANVPIIVAINKVDLPNANVQRTRNQLYSLGLIPDTMGGDTPFVETVAAKDRPRGIKELLDMISLVAELRELKANPKKPALGTCLEAKVTEGQGVVATLLVQNGTLHVGDCIVCGTTFGRVRAMFDSNGRPIQQAGPATPVAVTGLDDVPEAGDKFFVVPDLATAREIVERRRERLRFAEPIRRATFRLEDLDKTKVQELKIILKADVRGSIEAIKKELEKLKHEEIKLTVIHAGVGAITEGDVQLALASPEDTLIVGFNVVPDQRAQALAEQRHVQIRLYNIIYQLTEDLKAALEGRLKPREEVIPLGRAVVREVFKISKVGTVAGCYVVQGVVERGAQVRVIREGRIIYPPPDRTATIESLRRFKEDVREVREGFECGIKISNFDDVKVDDVLEVFRVVQVQRTLDEAAARPASS